MSEAEFRLKRRQKFLTEKYFRRNQAELEDELRLDAAAVADNIFPAGDTGYSGLRGSGFKKALQLVRLHYTAGAPIETLKPLYADAMNWFRQWHEAEHEYSIALAKEFNQDLRLDMTPLEFQNLEDFQLALDTVCIGLLLGELDRVREAVRLMQSARGTDMLLEFLLEKIVPDPCDIEEFFHEAPYGLLVDAIYTAETPEEASGFVKQYLENWYKAFEGAYWHDGHLKATDEYMPYEGYWAFEAAAVCVLHGIDDSSFRDHIVYPKDLADWARAHGLGALAQGANATGEGSRANVPAGQPCPETGWWFTPAKPDSRRWFKQGETMPSVGGDYGQTFWQWSPDQSAPNL